MPEAMQIPSVQKQFSDAVLHAEQVTPGGIVGPDGKVSDKRFSVYRNNVMVSLIEAMGANFPTIQRLLGEDFFTALARAFVIENPPAVPMLFLYGENFAAFLDSFEPVREFPYLGDVARVEFAWLQAYHAADEDILDAGALAAIPEDSVGLARFVIHPASWVFHSIWPVATIVARNRENGDCGDIDLSRGEDILITRPRLDVEIRVLPQGGYEFLNGLATGYNLEQAAQSSADHNEDFDLALQLGGMLESGVFTSLAPKT
jgi:hypothetical protein